MDPFHKVRQNNNNKNLNGKWSESCKPYYAGKS